MTYKSFGLRAALLALAASAGLVACGGGDDPAPPAPANGTLRVALTDAPACRVDNQDLSSVFVTVERVRVHQSADAAETAGGWTDITVNPAKKINLLDLTNGTLFELGATPIPAGNYTQVRLVLSGNTGNTTANSMTFVGQTAEIPLRTPSAMQSGLKIIRPFTVQPNTLVDLVIDFDACRSIVAMGNGGYALKPTLTADLKTVAGIVGYVDPTVTDAMVSAQKNGNVVRSTVPYTSGQFVLAYLDPANGPYNFVVTSPTRGTSVVSGVNVSTSAVTTLSTQTQPIPLPVAVSPASRTVGGTLGPVLARDTGVVRATQDIAAAGKVEVTTTNVDATDGNYSLTLPLAIPLHTAYSTVLPLGFAPLGAAAAYTLEAKATGFVPQTQAVTGGVSTYDWTLVPTP
jgi:hypothetical protein